MKLQDYLNRMNESVSTYPIADTSDWYGDLQYKQDGAQMVMMSPDEYLRRVRPLEIDDSSQDNIDDLVRHIQSGRTLDPLKIYADGREDGRHRAYAAKQLGIKKVPVIVWPPKQTEAIDYVDTPKDDKFDINLRHLIVKNLYQDGKRIAKFGNFDILFLEDSLVWDEPSVVVVDKEKNKVAGMIGFKGIHNKFRGFDSKTFQISVSIVADGYDGRGIVFNAYVTLIRAGYNLVSDAEQTDGGRKLWARMANTPGIHVYAIATKDSQWVYNRKRDNEGKRIQFHAVNPEDITDSGINTYVDSTTRTELRKLISYREDLETQAEAISSQLDGMSRRDASYKELADKLKMLNTEIKRTLSDETKIEKKLDAGYRGEVRLMATKSKKASNVAEAKTPSVAYELELIRGRNEDVLKVTSNQTDKWIEIRGKPNYETNGYDPEDRLHRFLDKLDPATVAALMAGDVKFLNPNNSRTTPSIDQARAAWQEPAMAEAIETIRTGKDEKFGIKFDVIKRSGKVIGRMGELEVLKTPDIGFVNDRAAPGFIVWDPVKKKTAGVLMVKRGYSAIYNHERTVAISVTAVSSEYEGRGLMLKLYVLLVRKGYALLSDDQQSKGGQKIWARLAQIPGITVYAVDMDATDGPKYSAVDPDDITDANFMVYDDDRNELTKLEDERKQLYKARYEISDELEIEKEKIQNDEFDASPAKVNELTGKYAQYTKEIDAISQEIKAYEKHVRTGQSAKLMAVKTKTATTESVQLNELFNQPYKWTWTIEGQNEAWAEFDTADDGVIRVFFEPKSKNSPNWDTGFKKGLGIRRTGEGDEFRIFATVIAIIQEFMTKRPDVQSLGFIAKREGAAADNPNIRDSRAELYKRLIQRFADRHNMEFAWQPVGRMTEFLLRRREQTVQESLRPIDIPVSTQFNQDRGNLDWIVISIENQIKELGNDLGVLKKMVNKSQVRATQDWLDDHGGGDPVFWDVPEHLWKLPIIASTGNGEFLIIDGHHRVSKDMKLGKSYVTGLVFDVRRKTQESNDMEIRKPHPNDTLGVKRQDMPQVHRDHYPELLKYLRSHGGRVRNGEVHARELKAVQSEFSDAGVRKMMSTGGRPSDSVDKKPLIVSSDNYIIDGHHRWLAAWNQDEMVPIMQVSLPVRKLLQLIREFPHTTYKDIHEERTPLEQACLEGGHLYEQPLDEINIIPNLNNDSANRQRAGAKLQMVRDSHYTKIREIGDKTLYMSNDLVNGGDVGYVMITDSNVTTMVGYLQMIRKAIPSVSTKTYRAGMAWVSPKFRRQGWASLMYEAMLAKGFNLVADTDQTKFSQKVWASLINKNDSYLVRDSEVVEPMNDKLFKLAYKRNSPYNYTILIAGKGNRVMENISVAGTDRHKQERKKKLVPGSDAWFKHWFSLPYLKREDVDRLKEEIVNHIKTHKGVRHEKETRNG